MWSSNYLKKEHIHLVFLRSTSPKKEQTKSKNNAKCYSELISSTVYNFI